MLSALMIDSIDTIFVAGTQKCKASLIWFASVSFKLYSRTVQIGSLMMTHYKSDVMRDADILYLPDKSSAVNLVRSINSNVMFIRNLVIFKIQKNFQRTKK